MHGFLQVVHHHSPRWYRRRRPGASRICRRGRSCTCWPWWARSPSWTPLVACTSRAWRCARAIPGGRTPARWRSSARPRSPKRWRCHSCWSSWWMASSSWCCRDWVPARGTTGGQQPSRRSARQTARPPSRDPSSAPRICLQGRKCRGFRLVYFVFYYLVFIYLFIFVFVCFFFVFCFFLLTLVKIYLFFAHYFYI